MMHESGTARARHTFGSYEIIETVGQGGMGIVYRAHDHMLNRTVALKVLRDDLHVQSHLVSRFQREARAVAALDHPNIVQVYSVGDIDGVPYIAMEFIEGRPLSDLLREDSRLPWEDVLRIGEQVAQGLSAAHEKSILHRDIKPGNILLTATGHAYLTDFGIAKILNAETQLTVDGSRLGTPHYMAPERCEGRDAGAMSDIYSLGIVLYQCMTGRLPFRAETPGELIEQILANPIQPVSHYAPQAPPDVDRLIAWVTDKDPRHRPATALRLADAMQRVIAGMPLDGEGPNLAGALAEFRERMHTPTPTPPPQHGTLSTTAFERFEQFWTSFAWRWNAVPLLVRMMTVMALAAVCAGVLTWVTAPRSLHDPQYALLAKPNSGVDRWMIDRATGVRTQEGPGVTITRLAAATLQPTALVPGPDGAVITALTGPGAVSGKAWQVITYESPTTGPFLLSGPALVSSPPLNPLAAPLEDGAFASIIDRNGSESKLLSLYADGRRQSLCTFQHPQTGESLEVGPVAATMGLIAAAVRERDTDEKQWRVAVYRKGPNGSWQPAGMTGETGPRIRTISLNPSGELIAVSRAQSRDTDSITLYQPGNLETPGRLVAQGPLSLPQSCWLASNATLGLIENRGDGGNWLVAYPLAGGAVAQTIAEAADATETTDGRLAALAPDRRGDLQIWDLGTAASRIKAQRTFLDGGMTMGTLVPLSASRVAAAGHRGAAYAIVDLSDSAR